MHTSSSETVHFLLLFPLYHLTIAFNAAWDCCTLRCMILRIFQLMMAPSMLIVSRFYDFSSAYINILISTSFDTLCALASISLSNSMQLEFRTFCALSLARDNYYRDILSYSRFWLQLTRKWNDLNTPMPLIDVVSNQACSVLRTKTASWTRCAAPCAPKCRRGRYCFILPSVRYTG